MLSDIAYKERQCNLFMQSFHLAEKHNNIIQHAKIKPKMPCKLFEHYSQTHFPIIKTKPFKVTKIKKDGRYLGLSGWR